MAGLTYILGGVGLFLLGMSMLTDGLKELAGDVLKKWLSRFTGGTFSAIFSGTIITAIIQSSSATTVLTIGFVSAGLLTFTQSIGIIIGANIGTTSTSWLVSLIGFKVNLNALSLPIIGIGIFLNVFAAKRFKQYGLILAGFGLLFLGIDTLQQGMKNLEHLFVFNTLAGETLLHKLLLIIIGMLMTVIMQSSSAAVATTLTALHTGVIGFEQAAFLVIGQNIGTTITALLASIGASIPAKRTAITHVFFNLGTGVIAAIISPVLLWLTTTTCIYWMGSFDPAFGIAVFHTLFNSLGVIVFLPFIQRFALLMEKYVPEKGNPLTRYLDLNVAKLPSVAIEASFKTIRKMMKQLTDALVLFVQEKKVTGDFERKLIEVEEAIEITRKFLNMVQSSSAEDHKQHLSVLHALDHIDRLVKVLREEGKEEALLLQQNLINDWFEVLKDIQSSVQEDEKLPHIVPILEETSVKIANERRVRRNEYFERSVRNETELDRAFSKVQALLWIDRLVYHYWRAIARITEYVKENRK